MTCLPRFGPVDLLCLTLTCRSLGEVRVPPMGKQKLNRRKRRSGRKGRNSGGTGVLAPGPLVLGGTGQLPAAHVRLRYTARYSDTLDVGNSYIFGNVMRGNSPYDPDATGVGGQAWGYDEFCALYEAYRCYGSTINVIANTRTAATTNAQIGLYVVPFKSDTLTSNGILNVMNMPKAKVSFFNAYSVGKCSATCCMQDIFPGVVSNDNNYRALTSANPLYAFYWHVRCDGNSVAADTIVDILIEVIYDLIFEEPVQLLAS